MKLTTAVLVSFLTGCASVSDWPTTARLYDLATGEIYHVSYENTGAGHGMMTATSPRGQVLTGEYTTISDISMGTGFSTSTATATTNTGVAAWGWAIGQGFSFNQPGKQFGSAILVGDGQVIDAVYAVDPWTSHGYGVGKDNKGKKYKIQF